MKEQLIVILTTTLSLLTAWTWNSALQQYIDQYYNDNFSTRVLAAIIVTIVSLLLINWLLNSFTLQKHKMVRVKEAQLTDYIMNNVTEEE